MYLEETPDQLALRAQLRAYFADVLTDEVRAALDGEGDGGEVFKRLMKKGIIVRSMVSYHLPAYIRVSIGTSEQNARFLAELPAALNGLISFKTLP